MDLTNDLYLVSNYMKTPSNSIFEESIQNGAAREAQWKRIVAVGANGRRCHVFQTPKADRDYFATLIAAVQRRLPLSLNPN